MEVSAVTTKSLLVEFNKAVEGATVQVKRGNVLVNVSAEWNETNTAVTLSSTVALPAGTYTVTVNDASGSVTVAPERIETIVLADNGYRTATGAADITVKYEVFNQYGEDVTSKHPVTSFTVTSSQGTVASNQPSATGTITIGGAVAVDVTSATLTIVDKTFAKSASKVVTINAVQSLSAITLDQPVLPTGKTKLERTATDVVIPYTAVNQYGAEYKLPVADPVTGVTFVSSNTTVLPAANFEVKSVGGKNELVIKGFGAFNGPKDVSITAIVNATGLSSTVSFTVYGSSVADQPTLVTPSTNPGVGDNPFNIELAMLDNFGEAMKAADIAALTTANVTIISSNPNVFTVLNGAEPALVDGKAVVQINAIATGTANLMITVNASGNTSTIPVTVVDAKYPASMALVVDKTHAVKDGVITLKATFKDQYGQDLTTSSNIVRLNADNTDFGTITNQDVTVTNMVSTGITLTASDWDKVSKVTAVLVDAAAWDANKVVDTKTVTVQSVKADAALTYEIKDIPTIYGAAGHTQVSDHAKAIEITGKTVNGDVVALPAGYVTNITSTNANIAGHVGTMKVFATDEATATIALWKGTTKLAETQVTASKAAPVLTTFKFKKEALTIDTKTAVQALADLKAQAELKDQYGVAVTLVGGTNGMWTSSKADIVFTADAITTYANVENVVIGFVTNNGLVATINVTITNIQ